MRGCGQLEKLPKSLGDLETLEKLNISGAELKELPKSLGKLRSLRELGL